MAQRDTIEEAAALAALLARANLEARPNHVAADVFNMKSHARALLNFSVTALNRQVSERERKGAARKLRKLNELAEFYGGHVSDGGDPRGGSVVKLHLPGNPTNGFSDKGWFL